MRCLYTLSCVHFEIFFTGYCSFLKCIQNVGNFKGLESVTFKVGRRGKGWPVLVCHSNVVMPQLFLFVLRVKGRTLCDCDGGSKVTTRLLSCYLSCESL